MVIFGDEGSMAKRFVGIDARVFLEGTPTSRRGFQLIGPGTRAFPRYEAKCFVQGLSVGPSLTAPAGGVAEGKPKF